MRLETRHLTASLFILFLSFLVGSGLLAVLGWLLALLREIWSAL